MVQRYIVSLDKYMHISKHSFLNSSLTDLPYTHNKRNKVTQKILINEWSKPFSPTYIQHNNMYNIINHFIKRVQTVTKTPLQSWSMLHFLKNKHHLMDIGNILEKVPDILGNLPSFLEKSTNQTQFRWLNMANCFLESCGFQDFILAMVERAMD